MKRRKEIGIGVFNHDNLDNSIAENEISELVSRLRWKLSTAFAIEGLLFKKLLLSIYTCFFKFAFKAAFKAENRKLISVIFLTCFPASYSSEIDFIVFFV